MSSVDVAANDLPTLIRKATTILDRVQGVLSPENEAALHTLIESSASTMRTLQTQAEALGPLINGTEETIASAGQLTKHLDGVVQDNREDIRMMIRTFRDAAVTVNKLTDQLNQVVASNRAPLRHFAEGTLPDLTALIIDARTTVNRASSILDSLQRNPARFIFGNRMGQGVELK
jgi:phospholipid/cholesterol/gamma-HCH transport system substrate-binding protein